jgi:hypothetical protein
MFDTAYTFQLVDHKRTPNGGVLESWLYTFISWRRRYQVRVERYKGDIYAIKYFADCHSQSVSILETVLATVLVTDKNTFR